MSGEGPISAVVVNYNGEGYLRACLDALLASEERLGEILVVDNASTDRSLALIEECYADEPRVRVLQAGGNLGPGAARNLGLRAARSHQVLVLDNDAVVAPDLVGRLRAAMDGHDDVLVVQPRSVFRHEPERVHYDGGSLHYAGLVSLRNFYVPRAEAVGEGRVEVDVAIALCHLLDRDRVLALGGYDPEYFILFEDLDLSFRVRAAGYRILSDEQAIVEHDVGTPGISFREGKHYPGRRVFLHSRNRWVYLAKCYRLRTLLVALPGLALYEVVQLAFAAAQGHLGPWCTGHLAALRRIAGLGPERRRVQASRRIADRDLLVGGPWTITPALLESPGRRRLLGFLDRCLALWWRIVRPLAG